MTQYTVGLYTLGCKVSQYETEAVAEAFERAGFLVLPFDQKCDVYVINTCTVTAESDRKSRQFVRRAINTNPQAVVMAIGCSVQNSPQLMKNVAGIAYLSGSHNKMLLPQKALELLSKKANNSLQNQENPLENAETFPIIEITDIQVAPFEPMKITRAPRTRGYVKIEDGCECRCTYCAIPNARGGVRSKLVQDVIDEVKGLYHAGTKEVVLTGIEIASWGKDLENCHLIDLLEALDKEEDMPRLRLGSLTPEVLMPDVIERLAKLRHLVPHFHLSIQSGCNHILGLMRRRYQTSHVLSAMQALRERIPDVMFTCDIMVGFPGETDAHQAETEDFLRKARFLDMHIFIYSRREGTPAATMPDQVPPAVGHTRSRAIVALSQAIQGELLSDIIAQGKPLS
ncbi:MAG: tRNA (N(6)-L-threonylcarbamoyladenosine(37)-C(2))-methylthiotransferase MtaB, partial [Clostridia bacterium]|nr:tRNA (N(6)-L-threonylcarbamoyladenosine(37)-C(2))-methylthiotransferase MtaB [Clostridia bacterium]